MRIDFVMKTVADIIDLWPSPADFAADLGLTSAMHARAMRRRGSIARWYWDRLLEAAKARGLSLTNQELEEIHAGKRQFGAAVQQVSPSGTEAA